MQKRPKTTSRTGKKAASPIEAKVPSREVVEGGEITNLAQALEFLNSRTNVEAMRPERVEHARVFNLDRMRALMKALGDPQNSIPCIHVAGSKGKGSVCEMLASILKACGFGVGLYTSPHLTTIRERIRFNNTNIAEPEFVAMLKRVSRAASELDQSLGEATTFELLTAMAFLHFAELAVDFAVIETGMGGEFDATNIINPVATVITALQLEHTQILGPTLDRIATHKAGIIKPGVPVFTLEQKPEAMAVIQAAATKHAAPLHVLGRAPLEFSSRMEGVGSRAVMSKICLTGVTGQFEHIAVPYMGEHQAANCALALCVVDRLRQLGNDLPDGAVADGLRTTPLNGRVQRISEKPAIFVDGAHNPESVSAAIRSIASHMPCESLVVVFGCAADKDCRGMIQSISQCADKVFFTRSRGERAAEPAELLRKYRDVRAGSPSNAAPSVREALAMARNVVGRGDIILVTGSFAIAGEAKKILSSEQVIREVKPDARVTRK
jgi:dihydrofolate synthase/folylpolyglutamate synthase